MSEDSLTNERPQLRRDSWPKEPKTITELMDKLVDISPHLVAATRETIRRNPKLVTRDSEEEGVQAIDELQLARIVAAGIMNFLFWAWDKPNFGYVPSDRGNIGGE